MKIRCIALVVFALLLSSCSILDNESKTSRIVGLWELESATTSGFVADTSSSDYAEERRQQLIFSGNGEFALYRADTLFTTGTYAWEELENEGELIISYDTDSDIFFPRQFVRFKGDRLILTDWCADCFVYRYVRSY